MDPFSCRSKFKLFKMKDVLRISAELAFKFPLLGRGDGGGGGGGGVKNFKYKNYCMSCKQKRKDDRLNSVYNRMVDFRSRVMYC